MHETASPKPLADARLIPLAAIRTSPTNPRAGVAKEDFAELAASIKEKGVLEGLGLLVVPKVTESNHPVS